MREKFKCRMCKCEFYKLPTMGFALVGLDSKPCDACKPGSPFQIDNLERVLDDDDTVPGGLVITKEMSDASRTEVGGDQHAQDTIAGINEETEKEGNEDYITGEGGSPGSKPDFDKA